MEPRILAFDPNRRRPEAGPDAATGRPPVSPFARYDSSARRTLTAGDIAHRRRMLEFGSRLQNSPGTRVDSCRS
jgi:hypothetical protein